MNSDVQILEGCTSRMATARFYRGSWELNDFESLTCIARQFSKAMTFKIPVGYQDEAGFHRGEPRVQKAAPVSGPEEENKDIY